MSKETLEELKAIVDNAPDGATHIDDIKTYWKVISEFDYFFHNGSQWDDSEPLENGTRSLSDIKRIIELMEACQGLLQLAAGSTDGYWRNELNAARKALGLKV